jgi:hypothetical protein
MDILPASSEGIVDLNNIHGAKTTVTVYNNGKPIKNADVDC